MRGRALVMGAWHTLSSQELSPAEVDAERMQALLVSRDFEVHLLSGHDATRERILAAYAELIENVAEGEPAVIFYSGHGGIVSDVPAEDAGSDDPGQAPLLGAFQFIVPRDHQQSTYQDFRGISSWELSLLLEGLTRKTRNVTVILDCCYSSQMSRSLKDPSAGEPRATREETISIRRHTQAVKTRSDMLGHLARTVQLDPMGNPNAVRLVACGPWSEAFSTVDERGRPTGFLTDALIATLNEIGDTTVSWRAIGAAIGARIRKRTKRQEPLVEGPAHRILFSLDENNAVSIPIASCSEGIRLDIGRIAGASEGDLYGVTPFDAAGFASGTGIARVWIERTAAFHAIAELEWLNGHAQLPVGAVAWPLELHLARQPVLVEAPEGDRPRLEEAVAASARLRVAEAGEAAIALLRLRGDILEVVTNDGTRLGAPFGAWSLEAAISQLRTLAAAQALRELQSEGLASNELEVEWGTVHGEVRSAQQDGAALHEGDRIYIRIRNRSTGPRYAHVFNVGLRGTISRLSHVYPNGIVIGPNEITHVGPLNEPKTTFRLTWPHGVPRDAPAIDRLVVIATTRPTDLGELETPKAGARGTRHARTALQRLANQLHEGGARSADEIAPEPFLVVHRSWVLRPLPSEAPPAK